MAFAAVLSASPHFHTAQTDLITLGSPSEALSRCLHLPRRSVQSGFTRRLRDGKNHIYFYGTIHANYDTLQNNLRDATQWLCLLPNGTAQLVHR